jgi:hypothetical protein
MHRCLLLDGRYSGDLVSRSIHEPYCQSRERTSVRKDSEIGSLSNSYEPECPKRFDGVLVENGRPLTDDGDVKCLGETERLSQKAYSDGR